MVSFEPAGFSTQDGKSIIDDLILMNEERIRLHSIEDGLQNCNLQIRSKVTRRNKLKFLTQIIGMEKEK